VHIRGVEMSKQKENASSIYIYASIYVDSEFTLMNLISKRTLYFKHNMHIIRVVWCLMICTHGV
jgi:hypothetical protein